ncbi:retrovirus-related pol polyprotein from transposon TNT 1-94 [Tanacetum coccineum]
MIEAKPDTIVKVLWNSSGPEFTWEREIRNQQRKYPHLFSTGPSSPTTRELPAKVNKARDLGVLQQETKTLIVQSTSSTAQQDELLMSVIDEMQSQVAKCNKVQQENKIVNETLSTELERYKEQVKIYEQRQSFELNDRDNYIDGQLRQVIVDRNAKVADFKKQIHSLKLQLNATVESHKTLSTTVEILKEASKQKEDKYLDEIIDLQKEKKALDNVVYKMGQSTQTMHIKVPALYNGHTIVKKHDALTVTDTEETLELAKDIRLKMLAKQNDETVKKKKVNIALVDYVALNKLSEHFVKYFVPQKQLSAEQAFWLPISHPISEKQLVPPEPVFKKKIPRELSSISLHKELNEMKEVFQQMETEVTKYQVDRKCFEIEKKELILKSERPLEHIICQDVMNVVMHADVNNVLPMPAKSLEYDNRALETLKKDNDRLMELLISQDILHTHVNNLAAINDYDTMKKSYIDEYNENLQLKAKLAKKNDMVEQEFFNINEWQAKLDAKDLSIAKLREHIANLKGKTQLKIVEHAIELRPLDSDLDSACKYTTRIQELLVYVSATCPSSQHESQKLVAVTPMNRTRKVRFAESESTSKENSQKHANTQNKQTPNNAMLPSTGIKSSTEASGSKPKSNTRNDRISQPSCSNKKTNKVEAQPRIVKPCLKTKNRVSKPVLNANVQHKVLNANSHLICSSCNECLFDAIHDSCASDYISNMHVRPKSVKSKKKKIWKCTGKIFNTVGYRWIPTRRTFTINGNKCPLTRLTPNSKVPLKKPVTTTVVKPKTHNSSASGPPNQITNVGPSRKSKHVVQIVLWYLDSGCSKHMTGHRSQLINFVSKFLSTVRFGNDQIPKIMGYGDYQLGNNLDGADLITGSRDINLYTISLDDMLKTSSICLLLKASKTKSWLWHRRLSHLNFGTLNQLAKDSLARGIPKLKYQKDHLCSACALGKSKKSSHTPNAKDTNQEKLNLLHMDLCGPMRVESINWKKYILLMEKDICQLHLREAACTMLIFSKSPLFLWAEAVNTACYTQNRSLIRRWYNKTLYELMHDKKPDLSYLHVFGSLCYPTNNSEDLGKLKAKADIGIFVGYAPAKKAF